MIAEPPGEPVIIVSGPRSVARPSALSLAVARSKTSVGAIELRGRLPPCGLFGAGSNEAAIPVSVPGGEGVLPNEKSVNWLFSRKPADHLAAAECVFDEVVIATALPLRSTIDTCDVPPSG